jgi:hypothetical protein
MDGTRRIVAAAALALTALAARAVADASVAQSIRDIESDFQRAAAGLSAKDKAATAAAEYEKLGAAALAKLDALASTVRAGGPAKAPELALVYEAMLFPGIAPRGEAAWELTAKVLRADPDTVAAWPMLQRLRFRVAAEAWNDEVAPSWSPLQKWASDFRADATVQGETQLALDLLLAELALDQGVCGQAQRLADQIVIGNKGSSEVRETARRIRGRASLKAPGVEAPPFRLANGGGDTALADLRGRIALVLFSFADDEETMLRGAAARLALDLAADDLATVVVPLSGAYTPPAAPLGAETSVAYGDAARKVGDAYGVVDTSALFLVGPTGQILKSRDWDSFTASEDAVVAARTALGAPLPDMFRALAKDGTWSSFPAAWRRVLARKRGDYDPATWQVAAECGGKALYALMLAAAASGKKPETEPAPDVSTLHGKIVAATWAHRFGLGDDAWKQLVGPFTAKSDVEALLPVVDALYDLGLAGDDVRAALEQAVAKGKDWKLVSMALRTLAFQDCDAAPPHTIVARTKDKTWQVRLAASEALRAYRHADSVTALIELLGDERQRIRCEAAVGLKALTREDLGTSQKQWAAWRRSKGQKLELPPRELNASTLARSAGHDYAVTSYFGAKVASDRVVLLLDKSETMYYSLFDAGVDETKAFLEAGGPTLLFGLIEFAEKPVEFRKKMVPANAANLAAAIEFLNKDKPYGPTNLADSMRLAISTEDADTIVYLSDGEPANRGTPTEPAALLAEFAKVNRYQRMTIHVVWMAPGRQFPYDGPRGKDKPPLDDKEIARRKDIRDHADQFPTGSFLAALCAAHGGTFHVAFADQYDPPPGAVTRPSTDK